mgnify:FL=1
MKNFKKLQIWQKGMQIVELTYKITTDFPESERFGLMLQCRKSAVSIPSNIAEGSSRKSAKDQFRFMEIAYGSSFELETQMLIAQTLKYSATALIEELLNELDQEQKLLSSYMDKLSGDANK